MSASEATLAAADAIEATYRAAGMPVRVRDLEIAHDEFPRIADATLKNFNANQGPRSEDERRNQSIDLLEAAW